jgi:hypothetical protein
MDPSIIAALMMMQQGAGPAGFGGAAGAGGTPMGPMPGIMTPPPGMDLGALLTGGGAMNPAGTAPSTSGAASPTGDMPVPPAPGAQPGFLGPDTNPMPGITVQNPALGAPSGVPGTTIGGIGSVPPGYNASTQSPGTTAGVTPGVPGAGTPSTQGQAAGNPLAGLAGFKAPPTPQPIMPHAGPGTTPHLPMAQSRVPAIMQLLQSILGARGTQPLGIPAIGASLRGGV